MTVFPSKPADVDAATIGETLPDADDVSPDQEEFGKAVLKNVFEIWFTPEIERRRAAGLIGNDFVLLMA